MKVFISWSGNDSKQVAQLLKEWIPNVLQGMETWMSSDDIEKGALWMGDLSDRLKEVSVGILCLTRNNIAAPWILFEAGALSKGLTKNRVCPLLINLSPEELNQPLSNFNATLPMRDEMLKLMKTINAQVPERLLADERVEKAFDKWWGEFEGPFRLIVKEFKPSQAVHRPTAEMLTEILELSRSIQRNVQQGLAAQTTDPQGFFGVDPFAFMTDPPHFRTWGKNASQPVGLPLGWITTSAPTREPSPKFVQVPNQPQSPSE